MDLDPREIVEAFAPYRPASPTPAVLQRNLRAKQQDAEFRSDLDLLIADVPSGYTVDAAAELVIAEIAPCCSRSTRDRRKPDDPPVHRSGQPLGNRCTRR
jgi:hypothetical protein